MTSLWPWVPAIIILVFAGAIYVVRYVLRLRRIRRDPKAFHEWAVKCVQDSYHQDGRIPDLVLDYMICDATKEWAQIAGFSGSSPSVQAIEAAERQDLEPLMRFQVSLLPDERAFFAAQATKQGR